MHGEGAFRDLDFSLVDCTELAKKYIARPDTHFFMLAEDEVKPVGFFMGYLTRYFFGPGRMATELAWYVTPEKRGSMAGVRLLSAFRQWGKNKGAKEICVGVSTGTDLDRTEQLLKKSGFVKVGGIFKETVNV